MDEAEALFPSLIGAAALAAVSVTALVAYRVPRAWAPATAIARGAVQLAIISLILSGIVTSEIWIGAALVVMFTIASGVATRRVGWSPRNAVMTTSSMGAGAVTAVAVVFATGALEPTPRYLLAIGAIIIGSSMTIATVTARTLSTALAAHWDEVEGWLALGASPRRATLALARRAVSEALIPSVDQTRTTGLVVLPGAIPRLLRLATRPARRSACPRDRTAATRRSPMQGRRR